MKMGRVMIAAGIAAVTVCAAPSDRADARESVLAPAWSSPPVPRAERGTMNGWTAPDIGELHRHVAAARATAADRRRERQVRALFRHERVHRIGSPYMRVTCRGGVCEYVVIRSGAPGAAVLAAGTQALNRASKAACDPATCQSAVTIVTAPDLCMALAGYFIATDSGFV